MEDRAKLVLKYRTRCTLISSAVFLVVLGRVAREESAMVDDGEIQRGVNVFEKVERELAAVTMAAAAITCLCLCLHRRQQHVQIRLESVHCHFVERHNRMEVCTQPCLCFSETLKVRRSWSSDAEERKSAGVEVRHGTFAVSVFVSMCLVCAVVSACSVTSSSYAYARTRRQSE